MSLLKYIERLKRMDDLIRRKATGTPDEFATRMGLGKSVLMEELLDLKKLGAVIIYCKNRQTYYYQREFILKIGTLNNPNQQELRGGVNVFEDFFMIRYYRNELAYFHSVKL
jgi:hypothetical protein